MPFVAMIAVDEYEWVDRIQIAKRWVREGEQWRSDAAVQMTGRGRRASERASDGTEQGLGLGDGS